MSSPYPDSGLTAGTKYWYRVRGWNAAGDGQYSGNGTVTTASVPGTPGTPTLSPVYATTLTVSWTAGSGATSYKVERAPDSGGRPGRGGRLPRG